MDSKEKTKQNYKEAIDTEKIGDCQMLGLGHGCQVGEGGQIQSSSSKVSNQGV